MTPIFLYIGPEFGLRNEAIEQKKKEAEKKFGSLDYHLLYAQDISVAEVISLLQGGSLFANARFIVLRNAELIKTKDDIELILNWINTTKAQKYEDAYLILVSDEPYVDKKLENLIPKDNKKIFWEMNENRIEEWLYNFFSQNGYKIQEEAVSTILEMIENNTETLKNECYRFFLCFEKGHTITEEDVNQILAHNKDETPFSLFAAITDYTKPVANRLETALSILQKIRNSKESNGIQFIAGLTWCFRKLKLWQEINPSHMLEDYELKKNGFTSKKMYPQYKNATRIWDYKQTNKILSLLSQCDIQIRQSGSSLEDNLLELMIYSIVIKKGEKIDSVNFSEF